MSEVQIRIIRGRLTGSPVVAALGTFDGVHIGHQLLLQEVVFRSRSTREVPAIISFYPHPLVGLGRVREMPSLTPLRTKLRILSHLGIQRYIALRFQAIAHLSAEEFIQKIIPSFSIRHLVFGEDLRIGKGREAGSEEIVRLLKRHEVSASVVPILSSDGNKVGSRVLRDYAAQGMIEKLNSGLGRPYELCGRRLKGYSRGTSIGFPTVNIEALGQCIPAYGVYRTILRYSGTEYPAVTNVGSRPTFNGVGRTIETHAFDQTFECPVGARVEVVFLERLRNEMKFEGIEQLKEQIKRDIDAAREKFNGQ